MPGLLDGWTTWRRRRSLLAQEWRFHLERATLELEDLGLSREEALAISRRRLGRGSRYWREAVTRESADVASLFRLWMPRPLSRHSWALPDALLLAALSVVAANPWRAQVLSSVFRPAAWAHELDFVDGPPPVMAGPVSVAPHSPSAPIEKFAWTVGAAYGIAWLLRRKLRLRVKSYGILNLALLTLLGLLLGTTAMQYASVAFHPNIVAEQLLVFTIWGVEMWVILAALKYWKADLIHRCPHCLERLRIPLERGIFSSMILDPEEIETICVQGHGMLTENRWHEDFHDGGSNLDSLRPESYRAQ